MRINSIAGNRNWKNCPSACKPPCVAEAETPATKSTFRISAPIIFPTANSPCPRLTAVIAVTSSGSDVPSATSVAEMMCFGTPMRSAMILTAGIKICAETTIIAMDPMSLRSVPNAPASSSSAPSVLSASDGVVPAQRIDCQIYNARRITKITPTSCGKTPPCVKTFAGEGPRKTAKD